MDDITLVEAEQIKLKQKNIARILASLAENKFDQSTLLQIYTVLGNSAEYQAYVGKLYTTVPSVSFSGGGGDDAAGIAVLEDGILSAVNITDPGHDYTSPPDILFTGGGGAGAAAHALLYGSGDTVGSVVVDYASLVSRLVKKNSDLDDDFAAL